MTVDLWLAQPNKYLDVALEEGWRQFAWHIPTVEYKALELFSWMRCYAPAYGPLKVMFIDFAGAPVYSIYSTYGRPEAVYPTWACDESMDILDYLIKNPPGADEEMCNNKDIPSEFRPVFGQKHRIVVHRLPAGKPERLAMARRLRDIQKKNPQVDIFFSGSMTYSIIFGLEFKSADILPRSVAPSGMTARMLNLPSGKLLQQDAIYDLRYADWFELIGMDQSEIIDFHDITRANLRSILWARDNYHNLTPFITRSKYTPEMGEEFFQVAPKDFRLPATRRRLMRKLGYQTTSLDKFACDTCILQNACTLYREGSVCTVKGSDTVALADMFGSRNAGVIMDGLSDLLKRNAERLEDALAIEQGELESEEGTGKLDPEVTKLTKTVFDQGVKLAKLYDPSLAGAKVQVNVGVNGAAQVNVGNSNPKELMASVVAELEANGVPREEIDMPMIKGVLRSMANSTQTQAVTTAVAKRSALKPAKIIQGTVSDAE